MTASLRATIEPLAAIDRESCSRGEQEAAEWIAAQLRECGASVALERERIHGTYWWPLGITSALALAAALPVGRRRRWRQVGLCSLATGLVIDELTVGRSLLRRVLPKQTTVNVVAQAGDPDAERTLVIVAHHDAAHSGFFFNPRYTARLGRWAQGKGDGRPRTPALMAPIVAGPAMVGLGALTRLSALRRLGLVTCAGIIASFADIALRSTVPGANDNLTGVAILLALGRALADQPVRGLRVLLVSTGAEESLMDGMRAFASRHFPALPSHATQVLCVDTVGSPHLVMAEGEGMLRVREYDGAFKALIADCAAQLGVAVRRGITIRLGTDGYVALRHGFPAALLLSFDDSGAPSNYHWPTDTPERVDYETLGAAVDLCERVVRTLADRAGARPAGDA